ncbi:hypothetical protein BJX99DRAFT_262484 [Aspergillus californicus]
MADTESDPPQEDPIPANMSATGWDSQDDSWDPLPPGWAFPIIPKSPSVTSSEDSIDITNQKPTYDVHPVRTQCGSCEMIVQGVSTNLKLHELHDRALNVPVGTSPAVFSMKSDLYESTNIGAMGSAIRNVLREYIIINEQEELPFYFKLSQHPDRQGPRVLFLALLVDIPDSIFDASTPGEIAEKLTDVFGERWQFEKPIQKVHYTMWRLKWFEAHILQAIWPCRIWSNITFDGGAGTHIIHVPGILQDRATPHGITSQDVYVAFAFLCMLAICGLVQLLFSILLTSLFRPSTVLFSMIIMFCVENLPSARTSRRWLGICLRNWEYCRNSAGNFNSWLGRFGLDFRFGLAVGKGVGALPLWLQVPAVRLRDGCRRLIQYALEAIGEFRVVALIKQKISDFVNLVQTGVYEKQTAVYEKYSALCSYCRVTVQEAFNGLLLHIQAHKLRLLERLNNVKASIIGYIDGLKEIVIEKYTALVHYCQMLIS